MPSGAAQYILIDLAKARRNGAKSWRTYLFRNLLANELQPLSHLLPRPIHVHIIIKNDGDYTEAKAREATDFVQAGYVGIGLLDGVGDEAFDI